MYIPVIPPNKEDKSVEASPAQATAVVIGVLLALLGLLTFAFVTKKGLSIGLMELAMIGAVVVIALGALFMLLRPRGDEEKRSPGRKKHNHPID